MDNNLLANDIENYSIDSDFFIKSNIKVDEAVTQSSSRFSLLKSSLVKTLTTNLSNKNANTPLMKVHKSNEPEETENIVKHKKLITEKILEKKYSSSVTDKDIIAKKSVCKEVDYLYKSPSRTNEYFKDFGLNSPSLIHSKKFNNDLTDNKSIISSESRSFFTNLNLTRSNVTSNASTSKRRHESFLTKLSENFNETKIELKKCVRNEKSLKNGIDSLEDASSSCNINYNRIRTGRKAIKRSPLKTTNLGAFRKNPRQQFIKRYPKNPPSSTSPKHKTNTYFVKDKMKKIKPENGEINKEKINKYKSIRERRGKSPRSNQHEKTSPINTFATSKTDGTVRLDLKKDHKAHLQKKNTRNLRYETTGLDETINNEVSNQKSKNDENEVVNKYQTTNKSQEGYTEYGITESLIAKESSEKVGSNDSVKSIYSAEELLNNSISEKERTISNFDDNRREKKFISKYFITLIVFMVIVTALVLVLSRLEKVRKIIINYHFLWIIPLALIVSMGLTILSSEKIRRKHNVGVLLLILLALCCGLVIGFFAGTIHIIFPFLVSLNLLTVLCSLFVYSNFKKTAFNRFISLGLVTVITVILTILQSVLIRKIIDLILASIISLALSCLLVIDVSMTLQGMHTYEMDERDYLFAILSLPIFIWQDIKLFKYW